MKEPCKVCGSTKYHKKLGLDGACRGCESAYCRALDKIRSGKGTVLNFLIRNKYEEKSDLLARMGLDETK